MLLLIPIVAVVVVVRRSVVVVVAAAVAAVVVAVVVLVVVVVVFGVVAVAVMVVVININCCCCCSSTIPTRTATALRYFCYCADHLTVVTTMVIVVFCIGYYDYVSDFDYEPLTFHIAITMATTAYCFQYHYYHYG